MSGGCDEAGESEASESVVVDTLAQLAQVARAWQELRVPMEQGPHVLVTGAFGQIGVELVAALLAAPEQWRVVALAHRGSADPGGWQPRERVTVERGDVCDGARMAALCEQYRFATVYHLAGVLSAAGEADRGRCWAVNVDSLRLLLELALERRFRLFWASSIAVFGPTTPRVAPQEGPFAPASLYGVGKVAGELLLAYYAERHGVDGRGLRFPGLVSSAAEPGGGTTDYACAVFKHAAREGRYEFFVRPDTRLPLMSMADALRWAMHTQGAHCSSCNAFLATFLVATFLSTLLVSFPALCSFRADGSSEGHAGADAGGAERAVGAGVQRRGAVVLGGRAGGRGGAEAAGLCRHLCAGPAAAGHRGQLA